MMTVDPNTPLDCGHPPTPQTKGSITTGRATDPDTGKTMCFLCAEEDERQRFATAERYSAYLTKQRPNVITTWTGAVLAKVTSYTLSPKRYTPTGGHYQTEYVRAEAPDGSRWHGQGRADDDLIHLRRSKSGR